MSKKEKATQIRRYSLRFKINLITVCSILLVTIGLVFLFYHTGGSLILHYFEKRTSDAVSNLYRISLPDELEYLWSIICTEEFKEKRAEAERLQDDTILRDWFLTIDSLYKPDDPNPEVKEYYTLMYDIVGMQNRLDLVKTTFDMESVYYQKMVGKDTYDILNDSSEPLWTMGQKETQLEEFNEYGEADDVPPTIYHSVYGWLCTACKTIDNLDTNEPVGFACADFDMNTVIRVQRSFLLNSIFAVIFLTFLVVLVNMLILQKMVIHPLKQLAKGTSAFSSGTDGYSNASVIHLDMKRRDEISDLYEEIRSMQTHIVTDTDRLQKATAEKERIQTELNLASRIQLMALPKVEAEFAGRPEFILEASMLPARNVGGDFYDFYFLDPTHLALVIADVSGKGIPASLFMMAAMNQIRGCASPGKTPAEILTSANQLLCRNNTMHMFVTVWMGILDLDSGKLVACNAGHENPIIGRQGKPFELYHDPHGLVLAGAKKAKYINYELTLEPGDVLFIYTDGIPEASNSREEFFGEERLLSTINQAKDRTPSILLQQVKAGVDAFVNDAQQFDDLTMLCILYQGSAPTKSSDLSK